MISPKPWVRGDFREDTSKPIPPHGNIVRGMKSSIEQHATGKYCFSNDSSKSLVDSFFRLPIDNTLTFVTGRA